MAFTPISLPTAAYQAETTLLVIPPPNDGTVSITSLFDAHLTVSFQVYSGGPPPGYITGNMLKSSVPGSWTLWSSPPYSETATPNVLDSQGYINVNMNLSVPVNLFGFETEPNFFNPYAFVATFYSGAVVLGTIAQTVDGNSGARLFAASAGGITKVNITADIAAGGLALANLRYQLPISASVFGGGSGGRVRCCNPQSGFMIQQLRELARHVKDRREFWPYVHVYPDGMSKPQQPMNRIAAPLPNVLTPVLSYQVPYGFRFYLHAVAFDVSAGAFSPGDALWSVDENATVPNVQGAVVQGLGSVPIPLGSYEVGRWWKLPRAYEFEPLTIVRSTVTNVNVPAGLPDAFTSAFLGYLEPVA